MSDGSTLLDDAWSVLFNGAPAPRGSALNQVDPDEIKKVFLRAARRCHPDLARTVGQDEGSLTRKFQELQAAYTTILAHLEQPVVVTGTPRSGPGFRRSPQRPQARTASEEARWGSPGVSMSGAHWIGPVPEKPLRFGRFLYYTGRITREVLADALSWQRAQRPDFGSLALELGLLQPLDLGTILDARRMDERIGRTAVRLGLLSSDMRDFIVSRQRQNQQPIGAYFVQQGLLTDAELASVLAEQQQHNDRAQPADAR